MPIGGGGPFVEAEDIGRSAPRPVFLKFAIEGTKADVDAELCGPGLFPGRFGAAPEGGLGAAMAGGLGAEVREDSGSDAYDESRFAGYVSLISLNYAMELASCVNTSPTLFQFWHSTSEQPRQLRWLFHPSRASTISAALVAITSCPIPRNCRGKTPRHSWSTS